MSPAFVPLTQAYRVNAVAAAAAHDFNEELTIIFGSLQMALMKTEREWNPTRPHLVEMQAAVQRCSWIASRLLNYTARRGARPSAATLEGLIEEEMRPK